jgi:acyl-CoA synthetase (AMP-forming)/AMP-acid ligase II
MSLLTVAEALATYARLYPDKEGTRDSQRALTFSRWNERANRLGNALLGAGLREGDRVAILAYNCLDLPTPAPLAQCTTARASTRSTCWRRSPSST